MRIAVLTLTRDRIDYTRYCFGRLSELAGCEFDHHVLDQGSTDGTKEWLSGWRAVDPGRRQVTMVTENVGIARGVSLLLSILDPERYDAVVKIDNDCELLTEGSLRDCAAAAVEVDALLSPFVGGLRNPPTVAANVAYGEWRIGVTGHVGGIFLAASASFYDGWHRRCRDWLRLPVWGGDDSLICSVARKRGMTVGYLHGHEVNHYETTDGQHGRFPWYFDRRVSEGGPA